MPRTKGRFVVLVGPDGVGKTSVAEALCRRLDALYFHFRPRLREDWSPPEPGGQLEKPSHRAGTLESVARLTVNLVRFWLGHLLRVRPQLRAGRHVVADRWAYGYLAKPEELRYFGPRWLARLFIRLLPEPSLVVCLIAPPAVISARKAELSLAEAERDLEAWLRIPAARLVAIESIDAPGVIADRIAGLM